MCPLDSDLVSKEGWFIVKIQFLDREQCIVGTLLLETPTEYISLQIGLHVPEMDQKMFYNVQIN